MGGIPSEQEARVIPDLHARVGAQASVGAWWLSQRAVAIGINVAVPGTEADLASSCELVLCRGGSIRLLAGLSFA